MKIVLVPVFKVLLVIVVLAVCLLAYLLTTIIYFLWTFKMTKYSDVFNNHGEMLVRANIKDKKHDDNIKDTIIRLWNLEFY